MQPMRMSVKCFNINEYRFMNMDDTYKVWTDQIRGLPNIDLLLDVVEPFFCFVCHLLDGEIELERVDRDAHLTGVAL